MSSSSDDENSKTDVISNQRKEAASLLKEVRCSEAENILRNVLPLVDKHYGETSPEGVSCYRDLLRAVACQRREDEVKEMMKVAKKRISGMRQSDFARQQKHEKYWLTKINYEMSKSIQGISADIEDRMAFMAANRGKLGYDPKK